MKKKFKTFEKKIIIFPKKVFENNIFKVVQVILSDFNNVFLRQQFGMAADWDSRSDFK